MKNKRILITGIAGSIGSELARQLGKQNKIYGIDNNESGLFETLQGNIKGRVGDIRDELTIRDIFSDFKPQIVFHAAALKHVPLMEGQPLEAIKTNILGLNNVLHFSKVYPVEKFVFISSDKAVDPDNIMGATKRLGEIMVKNSGDGYVVVRFGNVMGSRGSLIPIWEQQFKTKQPLTITDTRMTRYFMSIPQACKLVIEAAKQTEGIMIMDMGRAKAIIELKEELYPNYPVEIIGIRPGERLVEQLMSLEEEKRAIKKGKFYII